MSRPTVRSQPRHRSVLVVGGGQAGLSVSHCLKARGIDHLIFERDSIASAWKTQRWDSFCLVTPNWQCDLPGFPYRGDDPHGFILRDEIVAYVEDYARSFEAPVREGTGIRLLTKTGGRFHLETDAGEAWTADGVVVATGGYHRPKIPAAATQLPAGIATYHSSTYRNPASLPPGGVLVVGTGQSGAQIAEDLHLAGRTVHLCVGSAPRSPRRYRGRDVTDWLVDMGHYDMPVDRHPLGEAVRRKANHYLTGRDGGRELDLRKFASEGMRLYGRFDAIEGTSVRTRPNLADNLDNADASANRIRAQIDDWIAARGIAAPAEAHYAPVWTPSGEPAGLDLAAEAIGSVVWCTGFHADFGWIQRPVLDGAGQPVHRRGETNDPGLYVLGLPWLHTWGSGRFSGVGRDARFIAERIEGFLAADGERRRA
ncbi:FAD-dependent oxidoreductase [Aureimonas sp. Leaf454]|uniref:MSMEG_0569 family flavin-dependent oxidoreductase n=1 Tax=Aureimonas sp. Leaf454 TaxID=1736381 RepID=UPI0006F74BFD|nr:MSMEG_0569 family flavin-dependent oxidoreductase [Aureimonas sp. Leaf454]KQT43041.1 FAD-dependent oxidoreductase [Aureimonas sp. Leaf454]